MKLRETQHRQLGGVVGWVKLRETQHRQLGGVVGWVKLRETQHRQLGGGTQPNTSSISDDMVRG
ncbi:hypothetical protein HFV01_05870 [Limnospira fusiformis SAG 85.79]|uniref:Uncharacterized protein n=2 Tax=Limnospira TaxID=2596745 RepID=A0A9P1KI75_9CYAN|nr:hypothetical protein [Limnospira maxima]EKD07975.1 hypothetical protein SPLC1_S310360 [Arthrospira platensis C1]QJB25413.1 hypothetical protein HFV01_05870 [Limnospira fusiformis SAG 85.79]CDM96813.1 conserved protein of unknown function [Limnospira indica PCC 8005]EDZ94808.1 hypothetical protein AmaxDRAFT_2452 [Limnospira maxima CS-328]UWU47163.1 hypothetical protein APLC1_1911 [Arthrospira platensis C1]